VDVLFERSCWIRVAFSLVARYRAIAGYFPQKLCQNNRTMRRNQKKGTSIRLLCSGLLLLLANATHAFMATRQQGAHNGLRTFDKHYLSSAKIRLHYKKNPFDEESPSQREQRMQLVRQVQETFYADEVGVYPPQHGVYSNMPLYRGNWTELPGFQHTLNVTDPYYINMLMKVVSSSQPWYFGHVYLPGGAESIDDYNFRLEKGSDAPLVGTLMQVSDYTRMDNGGLYVVVQALGRFLVVDAIRHGSPYSVATVEMLPDGEMVEHFFGEAKDTVASFDFALNDDARGAACAGAIAEAEAFRSYEFEAVNVLESDAILPPVASFNAEAATTNDASDGVVHKAIEEYLSQSPGNMYHGECSIADDFDLPTEDDALDMEYEVWVEIDALASILSKLNPKANTEMPIPTQILGLLPEEEERRPWPKGFKLQIYAKKISNAYSLLEKLSQIKVDKGKPHLPKTGAGYPRLRRARRLSYTIWALLDTILGDTFIREGIPKQEILEMNTTTARLQAALLRVREINSTLRQVLRTG